MTPQAKKKKEQEDTPPASQALKPGEHNPFVHGLLEQAQALEDELRGKGGLHERIGANRDTLRQIVTTGFVSPEQAAAIAEFYPVRVKKAPAEGGDGGSNGDGGGDQPPADTAS